MADFVALAQRIEHETVWGDQDDDGNFAIKISPRERDMIVAALQAAEALQSVKLPVF